MAKLIATLLVLSMLWACAKSAPKPKPLGEKTVAPGGTVRAESDIRGEAELKSMGHVIAPVQGGN